MKGIFQLLKESFRIYKSKITVFLGIMSPAAILIILGTFIPLVDKEPLGAFIIAVVLLLTAIFIWLLSVLAILYAIKDNLNPKNAYKKSFLKIKSFLWVNLLLFCLSEVWIVLSGLAVSAVFILHPLLEQLEMLFLWFSPEANFLIKGLIIIGIAFLLFGIIFFIKLFLAIDILIFEEKGGMKALFQSEQLVAGKFWKVLWRFLVLGFILFIFIVASSSILTFLEIIGVDQLIINSIVYIVGWLIFPFCLIYGSLIYKDLREIKIEVPYQKPGKGRKIAYLFIGILGLFLGLSGFGVTANIIYRGNDIPPIDDSDLRLSKIEIPKEDNAFYYFVQAGQKVYEGEEWLLFHDIIRGEKWDEIFARELLEKNREAFYYFEKGIRLPYFQDPALQDPEVVDLATLPTGLGEFRELARIKSMRTIYLFNQGEEEAAFDQSIQIIQMGQLIQDSPRSPLITYLVGMAIKGIGLETLRIILPEAELSSERLKDYIVQLERFKLNERGLKNTFKMENVYLINTIEKYINVHLDRPTFIYKPNLTRRWVAEYWRAQIDNVYKNYWDIEDAPELEFLIPSWKDILLKENLVGEALLGTIAPAIRRMITIKCKEDFSVSAIQILMAIKAYQIETGKIPSSLEELVPEFISEIPRDPFDGQPIRFSSEKKIIWSVGKNLIDEGGSEDDITFKIEF